MREVKNILFLRRGNKGDFMRDQSKISILHDLLLIIIPIFVKSY